MLKIIELLGPSGIGKSSIYNELQRRWKLNDNWGVYHDIRYKRKPQRKFPDDYIAFIKRKTEDKKQIVQYENYRKVTLPNERAFFEKHPSFSNIAIELINKHGKKTFGETDHRFLYVHFLLETIEQLQEIKNRKNDTRVCLMHEGLLSRLMHLTSPLFSEEDLYLYLEHMPLSDGVIYLECEPEEVLKRISKRDRRATLHRRMNSEQILEATKKTQKWMTKSLNYVDEKGVPVYSVDANCSVGNITNEIIRILEKKIN